MLINTDKNAATRSEVSGLELPSFADATRGIYSVQRVAVTSPLPPRIFLPYLPRPRVNVYLCIKQALFIRPMNMHCLVAVARCRVQTRRYHCLINHIQSHRLTLRRALPPLTLFVRASTNVPRSPSSSPLSRRGPAVSSLRALRPLSLVALSLSLSLRSLLSRSSPLANRPQLTLIYVIFSGRPHVTALQRTLNQACPMWMRNARGCGSRV